MNDLATVDAYGVLTEPNTLKIQRLLPGPIERVWTYLTDSELRRQWFGGGAMKLQVGASFELVRRNDDLTTPPGRRTPAMPEELTMQSRITELDAPHIIAFTWGEGEVSIQLAPEGDEVQLTLTHCRLPSRNVTLMAAASWHMHLDILAARMGGGETEPFWNGWTRLRADYDRRLPA